MGSSTGVIVLVYWLTAFHVFVGKGETAVVVHHPAGDVEVAAQGFAQEVILGLGQAVNTLGDMVEVGPGQFDTFVLRHLEGDVVLPGDEDTGNDQRHEGCEHAEQDQFGSEFEVSQHGCFLPVNGVDYQRGFLSSARFPNR